MEQLQNFDLSPTSAFGAALLRFILAGFWLSHLWFKMGYRGVPAVEAFFKQQGLPVWLVWFEIRLEVVIAAQNLRAPVVSDRSADSFCFHVDISQEGVLLE